MRKKTKKKGKKEYWGKVLALSIIIVILVAVIIALYIKKKHELKYTIYQEICTKENSYFEEIANLTYGYVNESFVWKHKSQSPFCERNEEKKLTSEDFEDFKPSYECECVEHGIRSCMEGWELEGVYCYKDKYYTNSLKSCSLYKCKDNYYVEVNGNLTS